MLFYYVSGTMGMRSNGSFTRDRSRWITFTETEAHGRPYGSTRVGAFVPTERY